MANGPDWTRRGLDPEIQPDPLVLADPMERLIRPQGGQANLFGVFCWEGLGHATDVCQWSCPSGCAYSPAA